MPHYPAGAARPRLRLKLSPTAPRYTGIELGGGTDDPYLEWYREDWPLSIEDQPEYDDCLWEFIRLTVARPPAFRDFALKWRSLLGLCSEGQAAGHVVSGGELTGALEFDESEPTLSVIHACPLAIRERLSDWRRWAQEAWVLLIVAAHIRRGTRPDVDDWGRAAGVGQDERAAWAQRFALPGEAVGVLHLRANAWAESGRAHPIALPGGIRQLDLAMASPHLLGILGAAILDHASSADGLYVCKQCGWPGRSTGRRPRSDKSFFCSETCRHLAKNEVVKRSQRKRRSKTQQSGLANRQAGRGD